MQPRQWEQCLAASFWLAGSHYCYPHLQAGCHYCPGVDGSCWWRGRRREAGCRCCSSGGQPPIRRVSRRGRAAWGCRCDCRAPPLQEPSLHSYLSNRFTVKRTRSILQNIQNMGASSEIMTSGFLLHAACTPLSKFPNSEFKHTVCLAVSFRNSIYEKGALMELIHD